MHRRRSQEWRPPGRGRRTQRRQGGRLLMLRAISSYIHIKKRLHPGLLDAYARGGAQAVEVFAARGHFNYHEKEHIKELGGWFKTEPVEFHSMHSPIYPSNDFRSGSPP